MQNFCIAFIFIMYVVYILYSSKHNKSYVGLTTDLIMRFKSHHDAALRRMEKAGAQPTSTMSLVCEIQRDWARGETVPGMLGVLSGVGNIVGLDVGFRQVANNK